MACKVVLLLGSALLAQAFQVSIRRDTWSSHSVTLHRNGRRMPVAVGMKARFEDAEDRRLSKGGSGGRYGKVASDPYVGLTESQRIRAMKVDAYLDNDLEAADGMIGKVIAGSMLITLFGLLFAVWSYYGADGLMAATANQRAVRGI